MSLKQKIQQIFHEIPTRRIPLGKNAWLQEWVDTENRIVALVSEREEKLQKLQKCVDAMFVAWSIKKIEIADSETKETWIVTTLDPDNFQRFYNALDKFLVQFRELEKELKP